ncbi:hypothetical protein H105_04718 [Trichophyton soudanense CBS 452.61]|uniref:Uncharacterized protein n=1 Tax=Trichophyton soudanense CBS 452.61 TaxID=1215331 RepID=A0A022XT00_TRISD|nr:hypothetical protein H105_04718 [Trichophyton soudanense CBS 452.61]
MLITMFSSSLFLFPPESFPVSAGIVRARCPYSPEGPWPLATAINLSLKGYAYKPYSKPVTSDTTASKAANNRDDGKDRTVPAKATADVNAKNKETPRTAPDYSKPPPRPSYTCGEMH